ncbi:uncharacterized protein LOC124438379 isoform X2 [Xenia sp. Carnegie-2017]|uniref:uncharacterized protein LOC124438379 isoform X2 n=1 Tax=Xenia sp. Carnegie-2017 TaxID=2897299 RepID=UPI001F0429CF|nr:uncharacterized protein LOC124438379 isoform X2 [Xenia sp. Carnegie-2017]
MEAIIKSAFNIVVDVGEGQNVTHFLNAFIDKSKETCDKSKYALYQSFSHFQIGVEKLELTQESTANETSSSTQPPTINLSPLCRTHFKEAGDEAKKAFENGSLSIEEKIKASKIRIASAILEHPDNCERATRDFMLCLEDLNSSIVEGIKAESHSYMGTDVLDIVINVNLALANFIFRHTNKRIPVLEWPKIQYDGQKVHPFYYRKVKGIPTASLPWYSTHFPKNTHVLNEEIIINKEGELLIFEGKELQKLNNEREIFETWCSFKRSDIKNRQVIRMNIDKKGAVYLLLGYRDQTNGDYMLIQCLKDKLVQIYPLKFLNDQQFTKILLAATANGNVIIATVEVNQRNIKIHVCNKDEMNFFWAKGKHKHKHKQIDDEIKYLSVSSNDNIAILTCKSPKNYRLIIYTIDGKFITKMKFQPHDDEIIPRNQVIYSPATNSVTGFFWKKDQSELFIETFSVETKEIMWSIKLINTGYDADIFDDSLNIIQHAGGNVALVSKKRTVHFIKGSYGSIHKETTLKWMNTSTSTSTFITSNTTETSSSNTSTSATTPINSEPSETSSSNTNAPTTNPINSEPSDQPTCDSAVDVCDRPFKPKELFVIAQRICGEWRQVALRTNLFEQWEIDNIAQNTTLQSPSTKSNEMLSKYKSRKGTRLKLAKAIKGAGFIDIAENVQSGVYIDCAD